MADLSNLKILVIEDNEDLVRFHLRWMEKSNITPLYSLNGNGGIDEFKNNPDTDLIILDMNLPDTSGDKVFIELRKINNDIPVIFYSGYSNRLGGIEEQPNIRVLSKPFFLPALKEMVGELTGRK